MRMAFVKSLWFIADIFYLVGDMIDEKSHKINEELSKYDTH